MEPLYRASDAPVGESHSFGFTDTLSVLRYSSTIDLHSGLKIVTRASATASNLARSSALTSTGSLRFSMAFPFDLIEAGVFCAHRHCCCLQCSPFSRKAWATSCHVMSSRVWLMCSGAMRPAEATVVTSTYLHNRVPMLTNTQFVGEDGGDLPVAPA